MVADFKYDIAFSLLDGDLGVAKKITRLLPEAVSAFLYSERQPEIVGTDGVEKFSAVYARDARLVVVLHRQKWGQTKMTQIESAAIRGRLFNTTPEFLLLVKLEEALTPSWIPNQRIWADFKTLGVKGLAGALIVRLQELGKAVREETAVEFAGRVDREIAEATAKADFLDSEAGVSESGHLLGRTLDAIQALQSAVNMRVDRFPNGIAIAKGLEYSVGVTWAVRFANRTTDARMAVSVWRGYPPELSWPRGGVSESLETHLFSFDCDGARQGVWKKDETGRIFGPDHVADFAVKLLIGRLRPDP